MAKKVWNPTPAERVAGAIVLAIEIYVLYFSLSAEYSTIYKAGLIMAALFAIIIGLIKLGILGPHSGGGMPSFTSH